MRHRSPAAALIVAIALALSSSPAVACSVVIPSDWGPREFGRMARDAVGRATAIIDGEVVRPFISDKQPALVRAVHVLKGPQREYFEVGEQQPGDSFAVLLEKGGERLRLILSGGPGVFYTNLDQSNAQYEDRILKSDRRKVWPYHSGPTP